MRSKSFLRVACLKLILSIVCALLLLSAASTRAATYTFQGFGYKVVLGARGTRIDMYTGNPSAFTPGFVAGLTAICQASSGFCPQGSYFFETGWIKGAQTGGVLRHYISWIGASGNDFKYGVELTSSQWYQFQTLYSYSASRWEGWLNGVPKLYIANLGFTSGNRVDCGLESKSIFNSVPTGEAYCSSMRYRVGTDPWTYFDYVTEWEVPYCVYRIWTYGLQAYGPSSPCL